MLPWETHPHIGGDPNRAPRSFWITPYTKYAGGRLPTTMRARMRALKASVLAVCAALAVAGCGGGDSGSPLETALSYLPKDAQVVVALDTDLEGGQYRSLNSMIEEFAFSGEIRDRLREQLPESTDFENDIRPLLGNPLVVGLPSAGGAAIGAAQVEDEDKLNELVEKEKARKVGEAAGAALYQSGATSFATEGDVVTFAGNERDLRAALERADGDDHFDEETFTSALDGLPEEALLRIYADVEALLKSDSGSARARRSQWIGSLRTLGQTVVAKDERLETAFRLRTEGDLSEEDLPIASGEEAPGVISREGEVGLGIRDLAHTIRFAERTAQAIDPSGFGDYAQAKRTIDTQLGVSLDDDLIAQLNGNLSASVAVDGGFGVRAELDDPAAFRRTLAKIAPVLPDFAEGAGFGPVELGQVDGRDTIYTLTSPDGGLVAFGVVNDVLAVASSVQRAVQLGEEEPTPVEGANGSVVLNADAEQLANALIEGFGPALGIPDLGGFGAAIITGPLGDLSGHVSSSPDGLSGRLTLAIE